jgi:hypothetical protein
MPGWDSLQIVSAVHGAFKLAGMTLLTVLGVRGVPASRPAMAGESAGWDHRGEAGVSTQDWPRDPVGIEVVLNEDDARADHIPPGVARLINVVRQLGLVYDNTVYMDNEVPASQALLKVGKKLRK